MPETLTREIAAPPRIVATVTHVSGSGDFAHAIDGQMECFFAHCSESVGPKIAFRRGMNISFIVGQPKARQKSRRALLIQEEV